MPKDPDRWIVSAADLAEVLGISVQRVHQLVKAGMPKEGRGQFHLPAVWQYLMGGKNEAKDITEQKKALYRAQTEKHELDNDLTRGTLLRADVVHSVMLELATLVATQIDSIEPRIARGLPPEMRTELRVELKQVRESIADHVEHYRKSRDSSRDHPAAA